MVKVKKENTTSGSAEILESPDAIVDKLAKTEDFFKTNKRLVFIIGGAIAAVVAGIFIYNYYFSNQDKVAQTEMFSAVYYFENDSLDKALKGDGNSYGFIDLADKYGMTKTGNLSQYYAGVIYLKKGEFQKAIDYLSDFKADDFLVQARAYCLTGDAYMELNKFEDAAKYYDKAANHEPNKFFTPQYLLKAGLAYERSNNNEEALQRYKKIEEEFPTASEYNDARKHGARLEVLVSQ